MSCLFCCRMDPDDLQQVHSSAETSKDANDTSRQNVVSDDKGIIDVDYPTSPKMDRFDNQSIRVSTSDDIHSRNASLREVHSPSNSHTSSVIASEEGNGENQNAFVSFFSSIGDLISDQNKHEPENNEESNEEEKSSKEKPSEEKTERSLQSGIGTSKEYDLQMKNNVVRFFDAKNHASSETFEEDAIVIEGKISEEKVDIHIETTIQISPPRDTSVLKNSPSSRSKNSNTGSPVSTKKNIQKSPKKSPKTRKKSKNLTSADDLDIRVLSKLAKEMPKATDAERKRFLIARKGDYNDALEQLKSYIAWRKECCMDEENEEDAAFGIMSPLSFSSHTTKDDGFISCASSTGAQDRSDWATATDAAIAYYKENGVSIKEVRLPQLAHMVTEVGSETFLRDNSGKRILLLLPAQVNIDEVNEEIYALAIGFYLDKKLHRESMEKIVVAIDLRAGEGWPNPPAKKAVPFVKCVVSLLESNFPERLSKSILYPLPAAATVLWRVVKVFLDPNTAEKISVVGGGSGIYDKVSPKKFEKILNASVHERMEEIRRDCFITKLKKGKKIV